MQKISTLFCLLMLISLSSWANNRDSILLKGSVFNNTDEVKNATIEIYIDNQLYKVVEVSSSGRFRTYLPKNQYLMIDIKAPGFHEKRFVFDSHVPEGTKNLPLYDFDMDIYKEEELEGVNTSILDFPVGLVYFDKKKKEFVHNKKYTKKMKKQYFTLLEEAAMAERNALEKDEK